MKALTLGQNKRRWYVTIALIVTTMAVYIHELTVLSNQAEWNAFLNTFGLIRGNLLHFEKLWSPITYLFVHLIEFIEYCGPCARDNTGSSFDGFAAWHIISNMAALALAGSVLEHYLKSLRFAAFYLASGIIAGLAQVFIADDGVAFGASGAIFGVIGGLLRLWFTGSLSLNWHTLVALALSGLQAVELYFIVKTGNAIPGIGWFAHFAGLGFGLMFVKLFSKKIRVYIVKSLSS